MLYEKINRLRRERNAIILAHNYVNAEVQDIADFVGDSLELSRQAQKNKAPVIVFCGVSFMAETAKILMPDTTVIHPEPRIGCPMADMVDAHAVAMYRAVHPRAVIVAYVNTSARVKALVDICCTSSNAERVLAAIPRDREILFLPDQNLGANARRHLNRPVELYPGFCPTHNRVTPGTLRALRKQHPAAEILAHPECPPATVVEADHVLSTGGMLRHVRASACREFTIATEYGILHRMRRENPDKVFYPLDPAAVCPCMKKITLAGVAACLENMAPQIILPPDLLARARLPIDRMMALDSGEAFDIG